MTREEIEVYSAKMQQLWQEELFDGDDDSYCRRYAPEQQVDYCVNGEWRTGTVVLSVDEMVKCAPAENMVSNGFPDNIQPGKQAQQSMTQWVALDGDHVAPVHMHSGNDREAMTRFYLELSSHVQRGDARGHR
jgi:hypothetical protein